MAFWISFLLPIIIITIILFLAFLSEQRPSKSPGRQAVVTLHLSAGCTY
jgi:hypothetical protein